jgi:type 1 glutamine amidotransferase
MTQSSWLRTVSLAFALGAAGFAAPIKVLIVDGQNNHAWKETTPVLKTTLEEDGRFTVDVATTPAKGGDMSTFKPKFSEYAVVVSNYNGEPWSSEAKDALDAFVKNGGGFVSYHAADNAFPEWKGYQEMIAVGGWGGRKVETFGPHVRWKDGQAVTDTIPGNCGNHGARLPFQVTMRNPNHPIAKGLPAVWTHAADELYNSLCGPAKELTILGTAHSDPANRGTDLEEPMLMTIRYGKGRVFHTTLGHDVAAMKCVGFIATLQRGTEWAATGKVTQKVPKDFPTATEASVRK